ncbi:MAG: LysR family transcriptional regulator [Pseudomonadota bacterium]
MDQFNAMKAFCRVFEVGSFSAAAAEINVAHTVMSKQVRQLETELGVQLFNRTTRKLAATEAGQTYYEHARRILDAMEDASLMLSRHQSQPGGSLRINAPMAFGTLELAWWLPEFMALYPDIKVDLVCNDRYVDLIDEGFDVALRLARELPDSSLMAKRLGSSAIVVAASPAYLQQHGAPKTPADLAQHNCLAYTLADKPHEWTFVQADGKRLSVAVRGNFQANTGIALRAAALAGVGIVMSADFILHEDLRSGKLLPLLDGYALQPRELYAVYPQNRHLSPKVRAFIDFAAARYQDTLRAGP